MSHRPLSSQDLLRLYDDFIARNRDILSRKGHDYSGDTDRLRNFKASEIVHVSPPHGILVRIIDKITRISELLTNGAQVDESIQDTVADLANYSFLLYAMIEDRKL